MSNQENNQEVNVEKRQRRPRQHTNKEESDQFWKNNQYFNEQQGENEDDDSEEYYPQQSGSSSEEISKENNEDDYIDSLDQWEDCSGTSQKKNVRIESPQDSHINMIKKNLAQYSTMRGLHSLVDISTLQRLDQTSYVYFDEKQTFNSQFNEIFNRFYKSVPINPRSNDDEQSKCKTEFHQDLFDFEDKRYFIDIEILQLRRILKLYRNEKFDSYLAYRNLLKNSTYNFEEAIQEQIEKLKQKKKLLENHQSEEDRCFALAIDQQYYMKVKEFQKTLAPRCIQLQCVNREVVLEQQPQLSFSIYPNDTSSEWLQQYYKTYQNFLEVVPNLQKPLYLFNFQDSNALKITSHLLNKSIKLIQESKQTKWISSLFVDVINGLFNIDVPENDLLYVSDLLNSDLVKVLINQPKQRLNYSQEQLKPYPTPDDPNLPTETKLKFYPNFKTEDLALYQRPVFEYTLILIQNLYLQIQQILQIQTQIQYKEKDYNLSSLFLESIYKSLEDEISFSSWIIICKSLFEETDSIKMIAIIQQVQIFRRLFLQLDEWTIELLIVWIKKTLGDDAKIELDDLQNQNIEARDILEQMKLKFESQNTKMTRIQTVDGLMIIHSFELSSLY